jgi:hypothetical protein
VPSAFFLVSQAHNAMDQASGSPLWTDDGLSGAALLYSARGRLRHKLSPLGHGEGAETLWELTGHRLQWMSTVLRLVAINGGDRSVDSLLRWTNPGGDGLWWENVCGVKATTMTAFYTPRVVLDRQSRM